MSSSIDQLSSRMMLDITYTILVQTHLQAGYSLDKGKLCSQKCADSVYLVKGLMSLQFPLILWGCFLSACKPFSYFFSMRVTS